MRSSSPFIASAVRAMIGMARVSSSSVSNAVAARPSMPGSWMSMRIRLGFSLRAVADWMDRRDQLLKPFWRYADARVGHADLEELGESAIRQREHSPRSGA